MAMAEEKKLTTVHGGGGGGRRRRVLLFPIPFQGHINPMFRLAGILHFRGFAITVFHTHLNAPDPARHPDYEFVAVPEGISGGPKALDDVIEHIFAMNASCEAPFRELLAAAVSSSSSSGEDVACLVIDSHWRSIQAVAEQLGVPTLVLRTGSAACMPAYMAYPRLCQQGYLPVHDQSRLDQTLSELPPLRLRDLVYSNKTNHDKMCCCLARIVETMRSSSGLILNTFDALENAELEKIRHELSVPVHAIGPLHKFSPNTESSVLAQDRNCLEWLDKQATESVLYASVGSLASVDLKSLQETARGLADSGQPFLWVVRPDLIRNSEHASLISTTEEETRDRGRIVSWAPQQEVLCHRAIGGFWTHNGWNSTLESICEGVPMLCRPHFADQMGNARYVECVWKTGFELEGELERGKIAKAIRRLMCEQDGREMRERARDLKKKAAQCITTGGSSSLAIDKLVDHIMLL